MKKLVIKLLVIFMSSLFVLPCFSQTTLYVNNEKPGKLSKKIKKKSRESIVSLCLNGYLNSDDFVYLTTFKNLKKLDLTDICLTNLKEKNFNNIIDGVHKAMPLPSIPQLEELLLPSECNTLEYKKYDNNLPALSLLVMPYSCTIRTFAYQGERGKYKKLKITNVHILERIEHPSKITKINLNDNKHSFSRGLILHYGNFMDYKTNNSNRIIVDTLFLSSTSQMKEEVATNFDPMYISIKSSHQLILNRSSDETKNLAGITDIMPGAFINNQIQRITIPASISTIPDYCFYNCKNLTSIDFEGAITAIGKYAFSKTNIKDVVLPLSLKHLWINSFDINNIKSFKTLAIAPPHFHYGEGDLKEYGKEIRQMVVEIPSKTYNQYYNSNIWKQMILKENGTKNRYNITINSPGTIMSKIPMSAWGAIDTLTITGFLYDTDMNIIREMRALKYLDITHSFICDSPETRKEKQHREESLNAVTQLLGIASKNAYDDGKISSMEYMFAQGLSELQKSASEINSADNNCFIPAGCFSGLKQLQRVKLPLRAEKIEYEAFSGCTSLKQIDLPPYLKEIGEEAFYGCENLEIERIPQSVSYIGDKAFGNCSSIKSIDLKSCTMEGVFDMSIFINANNLRILMLPFGITSIDGPVMKNCTVYFPSTIERFETSFVNSKLHFSSKTPPLTTVSNYTYKGSNNTIYIPKNCTTAYFSAFGDKNSYVEE